VKVVNQQGCSKNFTVQIQLQTLSIPNTFSPNGDGINDYWLVPELRNYPNAYVTVVDRDGQVVFESRSFTRWDGRKGGRDLPAGVYFYRISTITAGTYTGWLNLVR
jgi:gliding motility-associated-like protein